MRAAIETVRDLEASSLLRLVAVGVDGDKGIGEVSRRNGGGKHIDGDASRAQKRCDTPHDVQIDADLEPEDLGFDGMDPKLLQRWMDEGAMPNFAAISPVSPRCFRYSIARGASFNCAR